MRIKTITFRQFSFAICPSPIISLAITIFQVITSILYFWPEYMLHHRDFSHHQPGGRVLRHCKTQSKVGTYQI